MHEQATSPNQATPRQLRLPETHGAIPLAELYEEPGAEIVWEENPHTQPDEEGIVDERQAIISAYGGAVYYLRGDTMYRFDPPAHPPVTPNDPQYGKIHLMRWTERTPLPESVTIGDEASFTDGYAVRSVLIAADAVTAGDRRSDEHLEDTEPLDDNPFEYLERALHAAATEGSHERIQNIQKAANTLKMAEFEGARVQRPEENGYSYGYTFRDPRAWDITPEDHKSPLNRHDPTGKNPIRLGVAAPEAPAPSLEESTTSHHGTPISPASSTYSSSVEGSDGKEYKPRMSYYVDAFPGKVGHAAMSFVRHPRNESRRIGSSLREEARALAAQIKPEGPEETQDTLPETEETFWGSARALAAEIAEDHTQTWQDAKEEITLLLLESELIGRAALNRLRADSPDIENDEPPTSREESDEGGRFRGTYFGAFWHEMGRETVESYWKKAKRLTRNIVKK